MSDYAKPTMSSSVIYQDVPAALDWLGKAFGFEVEVIVEDKGNIVHSEMRLGDAAIYVGYAFDERHKSPASLSGVNTQSIHIQFQDGLDAHYERAKAAGARIVRDIADQFYGDRNYMALDPEGHVWSFGQKVKDLTFDEMSQASGLEVRDHLLTSLDRTLAALADPRRRAVVDVLRRGPRSAGDLARELGVSPSLMSRQLRALREGGLVEDGHPAFDTRLRIYALSPKPMVELRAWLEAAEQGWAEQLGAFKAFVERPS